jgi:tetratricopeptide (TPR) repeat protein
MKASLMSESAGLRGDLRAILQGLLAATIGAAGVPAVSYCWRVLDPGEAPEWAKATIPNVVGAAVFMGLLAFGSSRFAGLRRRRKAAAAKGDRMAIYVADLNGDNATQTARTNVIDSILREIGGDTVEVLPAGFELGLSESMSTDRWADEANADARKLLRKKGGDLLIWGRVHKMGQQNMLELRFVGAHIGGAEGHRFGYTQEWLLEEKFAPEMGAALAAQAASLALPAVSQGGSPIWKRLLPLAARLERLVRKSDLKLRPKDRGRLLESYAMILAAIGDQSGKSAKLEEAVTIFRATLEEYTREGAPLDWAMMQLHLGSVLWKLGERESGTAHLEGAVAAFHAALEEWTRGRVPALWAATQNLLGCALTRLGERESGTARLEEAVAAFHAALEEYTRNRAPRYWAMTQNNLGVALMRLDEREGGTAHLKAAAAAFRATLEEYRRDRAPLYWASAQNNLGIALATLGKRESGTAYLEQAVGAYRAALEERTRDRVPLDWAQTQHNLGSALEALGERESGTARLEAAVAAYEATLEEWTRDRVPLLWASTQNNLGEALRALGERESGTGRLQDAVVAFQAALEERTRDRVPLDWAMTQYNLGRALWILGIRESGTACLEEAVSAYDAAITVYVAAHDDYRADHCRANRDGALRLLDKRQR